MPGLDHLRIKSDVDLGTVDKCSGFTDEKVVFGLGDLDFGIAIINHILYMYGKQYYERVNTLL